ncbi:DUF664 domain-containing protein [Chitinophaga sp. Mgbs1]|uniref:DUF664 domain-containing protein n=1 Tax=Chitinophaga solisilvae TaxID=1233460 RepID=A0A3S1CWF7_9BACT|nr:DUF664 domain-containing protein [Chitinophaga solisilvae]
MKELLVHYASYNCWANQQIIAVLLKLDEAQTETEVGGSFPSLKKTVLHLWFAESIWHQRLLLTEKPVDPSAGFTGSFEAACRAWQQQSQALQEWVKHATPVRLEHTLAYNTSGSGVVKLPVHDALMHVFNHSTYHRGQLVNMIRMLGISTKIPPLDYRHYKPRK